MKISILFGVCLAIKTLIIVDDTTNYKHFLSTISHHTITLHNQTTVIPVFSNFGERLYDNVAVLDPTLKSFGGVLKVAGLLDFVNMGGNVLLIANEAASEATKDFAAEFSLEFTSVVKDHFADVDGNVKGRTVSPHVSNVEFVMYSGIGHRLSGKNDLIHPVLTASDSAYTGKSKSISYGSDVLLVSSFQALNSARVTFIGSKSLLQDKYYPLNKQFASDLINWTFKEKSVIRVKSSHHGRVGEVEQHGIYRIKDEMVYRLELEQWSDHKWSPFTPKDVQFEAIMLDPYIRRTFTPYKTHLGLTFKLPDHYGVFTFKVSYKRNGLSTILVEDVVQVRPFRHDQYPRFLVVARPYYTNVFSLMAAFFALSVVFLLHKEGVQKVKKE